MRVSRTTLTANGRSLALLSLLLGAVSVCSAASITYEVNQTIGAGGVTGFIETDGTIGVLGASNIIDWNLTLTDGTNTSDIFGPDAPPEIVGVLGSDLSATATQLSFDFSSGLGLLYFTDNAAPGGSVCFENVNNCLGLPGLAAGEVLLVSPNPQFTSVTGTQVIGTVASAPEPSTLALLGAGIAFVGFRKLRNSNQVKRLGRSVTGYEAPESKQALLRSGVVRVASLN